MNLGEGTWELVKRGIRSVAASVPVAASLSQAWSEFESVNFQARVEEFFVNFRAELEAIEAKVDDIRSKVEGARDEFPSLMETAVECVRREPTLDKRLLLVRCMVRLLILEPDVELSEKAALIRELDTLTDTDLKVLAIFSDNRGHQLDKVNWTHAGIKLVGKEQEYLLYGSLSKLEARGLIAGTSMPGGGVNYLGEDDIPKNWAGLQRIMWILPRGDCLLRSLLADGKP